MRVKNNENIETLIYISIENQKEHSSGRIILKPIYVSNDEIELLKNGETESHNVSKPKSKFLG